MAILPYLPLAVLLALGLFFPRSRLWAGVTAAYTALLIGLNTASPDYANNAYMYDRIFSGIYDAYEPGFVWLSKLCWTLWLDFTGFRCVVAAIFGIVLYGALLRFSPVPALAAAIALLYPCVSYASALRSCIPFAISIWAVGYLLQQPGKPGLFKFLGLSLLAALFHYSSVSLLLLALCRVPKLRKYYWVLPVLVVAGLAAVYSGLAYTVLSAILPSVKVLNWFRPDHYDHPSLPALVFVYACFAPAALWAWRQEAYRMFLLLAGLFLPLFILNFTFERFLSVPVFAVLAFAPERTAPRLGRLSLDNGVRLGCAAALNLGMYLVVHQNLYFPILANNLLFQ